MKTLCWFLAHTLLAGVSALLGMLFLAALLSLTSCVPVPAHTGVDITGPVAPPLVDAAQAVSIATGVVERVHGPFSVDGWSIDFEEPATVQSMCAAKRPVDACTIFEAETIPTRGLAAIAHEFLHVAQGADHIDYQHTGPEWAALGEELNRLAAASSKGVWYAP